MCALRLCVPRKFRVATSQKKRLLSCCAAYGARRIQRSIVSSLLTKLTRLKINIYSSLCTGSVNIFIFVQVVKLENASLHVVKVVSTALFPLIALLFLGQIALLALTKAVDNLGSRACCPLGIFFAVHLHPLCVGLGL